MEPLERVSLEITDGSHFSPKLSSKGYPYITVRDIENDQIDFENCKFISDSDFEQLVKNGCKPNKGDVLFSKDGTVGKVALIDYEREFVVLSSLAIVRPDSRRIDSAYLKYMMQSPTFLAAAIGKKTGAAIRRIILRDLKSIRLPVPSLPEQRRIVNILDEAFDGIAIANANAEKNLQNARALFESHLQAVFVNRKKHWLKKQLSSFCEIKHGYAFEGADFSVDVPDGLPLVITPGNFTEYGELIFTERNAKRFSGKVPTGFLFDRGDLVVVMTDLSSKMKILGKPAFVESANVLHNQRIGRVVFLDDIVEKRLLYYYLMTEGFLKNIKGSATGTMVKHTAPKRILANVISFPPDRKEQRELISQFDDFRAESRRLESIYQRKLAALDELKQSMLHQAFSGAL